MRESYFKIKFYKYQQFRYESNYTSFGVFGRHWWFLLLDIVVMCESGNSAKSHVIKKPQTRQIFTDSCSFWIGYGVSGQFLYGHYGIRSL